MPNLPLYHAVRFKSEAGGLLAAIHEGASLLIVLSLIGPVNVTESVNGYYRCQAVKIILQE